MDLVRPILARQRELNRRLQNRLPAADGVQTFLDAYLEGTGTAPRVPRETLVLDQPGLARVMSLPYDGDTFTSAQLTSYRLANGILHNPANDRRTTQGVFHIAEGGLPIQDDKLAVPRSVFGRLLEHAFTPPAEAMVLPYTSNREAPTCWASLLLRPSSSPRCPVTPTRWMETRFFAPATSWRTSTVEGIFGNGGDPCLSRTTPRSTRRAGPATSASSCWRRIHPADEEGLTSTTPPSASAATACAGRRRTSATTAPPSRRAPATSAA